jgi:hypothetical protein
LQEIWNKNSRCWWGKPSSCEHDNGSFCLIQGSVLLDYWNDCQKSSLLYVGFFDMYMSWRFFVWPWQGRVPHVTLTSHLTLAHVWGRVLGGVGEQR